MFDNQTRTRCGLSLRGLRVGSWSWWGMYGPCRGGGDCLPACLPVSCLQIFDNFNTLWNVCCRNQMHKSRLSWLLICLCTFVQCKMKTICTKIKPKIKLMSNVTVRDVTKQYRIPLRCYTSSTQINSCCLQLYIDINVKAALPPRKQVSVSSVAVYLLCSPATHTVATLRLTKKQTKQSEAAEFSLKFINKSLKFTHIIGELHVIHIDLAMQIKQQ